MNGNDSLSKPYKLGSNNRLFVVPNQLDLRHNQLG